MPPAALIVADGELDAAHHVDARFDVGAGQIGDDADIDRLLGGRRRGMQCPGGDQTGSGKRE